MAAGARGARVIERPNVGLGSLPLACEPPLETEAARGSYEAIDGTKPLRIHRFGATDDTKPYEFIGFGTIAVTKPFELIGFGDLNHTCGK